MAGFKPLMPRNPLCGACAGGLWSCLRAAPGRISPPYWPLRYLRYLQLIDSPTEATESSAQCFSTPLRARKGTETPPSEPELARFLGWRQLHLRLRALHRSWRLPVRSISLRLEAPAVLLQGGHTVLFYGDAERLQVRSAARRGAFRPADFLDAARRRGGRGGR